MSMTNDHSRRTIRWMTLVLLFFSVGLYTVASNSYWLMAGLWSGIPLEEDLVVQEIVESPVVIKQESMEAIPVIHQTQPDIGEQYAELVIPRLDRQLPIYYGVEDDQLKKGIGHIQQTALPGEKDNMVLSGHRDTVFRRLQEMQIGDQVAIKTDSEIYTYKIKKIRVVDKDDQTVIVPKPRATLTITTCYPFGYVGPAPERYVLVAELTNTENAT
ncbi:class D sortase [Bacillus alkalicellulosilyticus]|uniref:class D sortase n=1 Tax=Alkalihalobacterium alkalicellulosilyticum TaxID=1912214 RepID=UPI001FE287AC|nr:class D sortase [Bacillus alkalicellulosilyticus]